MQLAEPKQNNIIDLRFQESHVYIGNPFLLAKTFRLLTACSFVHKTRHRFFVGFHRFYCCAG